MSHLNRASIAKVFERSWPQKPLRARAHTHTASDFIFCSMQWIALERHFHTFYITLSQYKIIIFPPKAAWPRSRDFQKLWHTIKHIFKIIWTSDFKFGTLLHLGKPGGTQSSQIFTQKGASPRSRDPKSFWHTIENVFKTAWARYFKFGTQLHLGRPSGRTNNFFSEQGRGPRHVPILNVLQMMPDV